MPPPPEQLFLSTLTRIPLSHTRQFIKMTDVQAALAALEESNVAADGLTRIVEAFLESDLAERLTPTARAMLTPLTERGPFPRRRPARVRWITPSGTPPTATPATGPSP